MSLKFSDLKRIPKGTALPPEANSIVRAAVTAIGDKALLRLMERAELRRWHGELTFPKDGPRKEFEAKFRHGVFQYFKARIEDEGALFWINVINDNVIFSAKKAVPSDDEEHSGVDLQDSSSS